MRQLSKWLLVALLPLVLVLVVPAAAGKAAADTFRADEW